MPWSLFETPPDIVRDNVHWWKIEETNKMFQLNGLDHTYAWKVLNITTNDSAFVITSGNAYIYENASIECLFTYADMLCAEKIFQE